MKLRNFLYLNTKLIDNYLSAFEGYIYDTESHILSDSNSKAGGLKANVIKSHR